MQARAHFVRGHPYLLPITCFECEEQNLWCGSLGNCLKELLLSNIYRCNCSLLVPIISYLKNEAHEF